VAVPDQFAEAESKLAAVAQDLTVTDTRQALSYWRQSVDGPGTVFTEVEEEEMRGISASPSLDGMVRIDGWMTRLAGEALITALNALMPPPVRDDSRTPRQRRHDALETWPATIWKSPTPPPWAGRSRMSTWSATSPPCKGYLVGSTRPRPGSCSRSANSAPSPVTAH
jgi:hypothetical protein